MPGPPGPGQPRGRRGGSKPTNSRQQVVMRPVRCELSEETEVMGLNSEDLDDRGGTFPGNGRARPGAGLDGPGVMEVPVTRVIGKDCHLQGQLYGWNRLGPWT